MQMQIAKFELYPAEDPTGYAVGFSVTTSNNRQFYRDTIVNLSDATGKSDEEIVAIGYSQLKDSINNEVARLEAKSSLLGNVWSPPQEESITEEDSATPTE